MKTKTTQAFRSVLTLSTAIFTSTVLSAQADIDRIEAATSDLNIEALKKLSVELLGYDAALANYRLAMSANFKQQSGLADKALGDAMSLLETLKSEQSDNVEVTALLAQVYGFKIALSPIKGIIYGNKSQQALEDAMKLEPSNPRVLLVKGIGAINTPPMFGGSKEVALTAFNASIEAYKDDVYSNYHWGHSEAYTWRGLLYSQQGEQKKAVADWQKALQVDPSYGWARTLLAEVKD